MGSLNKDTAAAVLLLFVTGAFFWETFNIPILGLIQSLRKREASDDGESAGGFVAGVVKYRNPIMCFVLFFVFLLTVEFLGMLIGGVLLTFALLTAIGNRTPKALAIHVVISLVAVGTVWSLFTFVLRVYLPEGELFSVY
jgi:hypothetical protein